MIDHIENSCYDEEATSLIKVGVINGKGVDLARTQIGPYNEPEES